MLNDARPLSRILLKQTLLRDFWDEARATSLNEELYFACICDSSRSLAVTHHDQIARGLNRMHHASSVPVPV